MKRTIFILTAFMLFACTNKKTKVLNNAEKAVLKENLSEDQARRTFVSLEDLIPDIHLDIRYYGTNNFIGQRIDGYLAPKALLNIDAAKALLAVQKELKSAGLGILVYDAYRPQRAVDHFVRWAKDENDTLMKASFYPEVAKANLFKEDYIAAKSGHSRGSTLDITLIDLESGKPLDMGSNYDFFGIVSWPNHPHISEVQKKHRILLQSTMIKHGFAPYAKEWWHFTLKNEAFPDTYFDFVVE